MNKAMEFMTFRKIDVLMGREAELAALSPLFDQFLDYAERNAVVLVEGLSPKTFNSWPAHLRLPATGEYAPLQEYAGRWGVPEDWHIRAKARSMSLVWNDTRVDILVSLVP